MPKFLETKLKKEYPNNPHAVYGTMNAIGAMKGNKITAKGREMEKKHEAKMEHGFASTHIKHHGDGSHSVEHIPHPKSAGKSGAFMEHGAATSYSAGNTHELLGKMSQHLGGAQPEPELDEPDGDES